MEIKYTELKRGDTVAWKTEINGEKITLYGVIKTFHTCSMDPIGCIETVDGKFILRRGVDYKIVSDQKIYVINK